MTVRELTDPTQCPCCGAAYPLAIKQIGLVLFACDLCQFEFEQEDKPFLVTAEGVIGYEPF